MKIKASTLAKALEAIEWANNQMTKDRPDTLSFLATLDAKINIKVVLESLQVEVEDEHLS
jgi:hypothetical protein